MGLPRDADHKSVDDGQTERGQAPLPNLRDSPATEPFLTVGLLEAVKPFDPTTLEIYRALYTSVAEEMGIALRRTAFSPNIKERRDYSCAVFDRAGRVIAQGDHMPVHLGSMPMAVASALREVDLKPGDVVALNDPFAGGTHLPDVTLVMAVFSEVTDDGRRQKAERTKRTVHRRRSSHCRPLFYVANRAHHADIGGATPGSMGLATDIYGEGLCIPPIRLVRNGELDEDVMRLILANVRGHDERRGDFQAQIGSLKTGAMRLLEIVERRGAREAAEYATHLIEYSARLMRHAIGSIPDGDYEAEDVLDDDGVSDREIPIKVRITIKGQQRALTSPAARRRSLAQSMPWKRLRSPRFPMSFVVCSTATFRPARV